MYEALSYAATGKKHNGGKRLMIDFALDDARILRQRRIKQVRVYLKCTLNTPLIHP